MLDCIRKDVAKQGDGEQRKIAEATVTRCPCSQLRADHGDDLGAPEAPSDRSQPAYQKSLKEIREAVSDRGRGVRSRGERPPARGTPNHRR